MASSGIRGLSVGTSSSKQLRKYLGDAHDPHFVPKSPLIGRRNISEKDEAELKRMCAAALANVPHSDDMADDPFRYLASHIIVRQPDASTTNTGEQRVALASSSVEKTSALEPTPVLFGARVGQRSMGADTKTSTATPSETSKRETFQSTSTTPMTTPGVTPAETGKRFSDAVVSLRPSTAQPSNLRTEIKTFKGNAVYAFLKDPLPSMTRPQTATATKSLTFLPSFARTKSSQKTLGVEAVEESHEQTKANVICQPDFNKSLPAIPKPPIKEETKPKLTIEEPLKEKDKTRGISRMLKTVRLQRTQTSPEVLLRSTSTDVPRQLQLPRVAESTNKIRRFNISAIFQRRNSSNPKRATVG